MPFRVHGALLGCRLSLLAALLGPVSCAAPPEPELPTRELLVAGHRLTVEVAATPADRQVGLMFRKSLPEDRGMLFVFEDKALRAFWMKNTYVPLSIAFLADDGAILQIESMEPETLIPHTSREPCRFALEVNRGWFSRRGIGVGDRVEGLPPAAPR